MRFKIVSVTCVLFCLVSLAVLYFAPPRVLFFRSFVGDTQVELCWIPPLRESKVRGYLIKRSLTTYPRSPEEGELVYGGRGCHLLNVASDRGLENGSVYYYSIFTLDHQGHYTNPVKRKARPTSLRHINLIKNGTFNEELAHWKGCEACKIVHFKQFPRSHSLEISSVQPVEIYQEITKTLQPETLYTFSCALYVPKGEAYLSVKGGLQNEQQRPQDFPSEGFGSRKAVAKNRYWEERRFVFWTGKKKSAIHPFDGSITLVLALQPNEKGEGLAYFTQVQIVKGMLPMPQQPLDETHPFLKSSKPASLPLMQWDAKEWNFNSGWDDNEWRVFNGFKSDPKNMKIDAQGNLVLTAWGNQAEERSGAIFFSHAYFSSGRFDVWAKIGPFFDAAENIVPPSQALGVSFTFWNFNFIHYENGEPQWYDDPSPIRNSEIDWEMPSNFPAGFKHASFPFCPDISWNHSRLSTWGGQRGGEREGNITLHTTLPQQSTPLDGQFHQYTFVWNAGKEYARGRRKPGYVEWYFDTGERLKAECRVGKWIGANYGFDNIPFRSARMAFSVWFPEEENGYGSPSCPLAGWAGTPNWLKAEFRIKKIGYTPCFEGFQKSTRDRWQTSTESHLKWF